MTPAQALAQLLDIPPPFQRPGSPYQWILSSLAGAEALYTQASDGVQPMVASISTAQGPWLSVWGEVFDLPRNPGEADAAYRARILFTLTSPVGPPLAIQAFSRLFLGSPEVYVTENLPAVGYTISITTNSSSALLDAWILGLARIRPAGVPFLVGYQTNPLMLGTYSYVGASGFAGSYLGYGSAVELVGVPFQTNNAAPSVPDLLLTDPLLNGTLTLGLPPAG